MCLSINIILIILSCSWLTTCTSKFGQGENIPHKTSKSGTLIHQDCYVRMPLVNFGFMPIPFEGNFTETDDFEWFEMIRELNPPPSNPRVIRPNQNGYLFFKHNSSYKLSCSKNEFKSPTKFPVSEVTVKCFNGSFEYEGKAYEFSKFECDEIPKSSLYSTEKVCQEKEYHEIIKVGFQSRDTFLNLYRICFDPWYKNTLYAWYFVKPPFYQYQQITKVFPHFIKTREFDLTDPREAYENQTKILNQTFNIDDMLDENKNKNMKIPFILPGHLISEHEFVYVAEKFSTYYYENTAPQWLSFNYDVWNALQKSFRRNLVKITSKHLVVTGTIFMGSLKNATHIYGEELFLIPPNYLAVPAYFWKMDYDLDKKSGIVYIGVNSPYKKTEHKNFICDTIPCPGRVGLPDNKISKLVYCCSKESFEKIYGIIDPVVYREF